MSLNPLPRGSALVPGGWLLSLYPDAAEAGGGYRGLERPAPRGSGRSEPGRALAEAQRRAKGKVRRYCAANGLNRLGTLTYRGEGCHDPVVVRGDIARFFRGLRGGLGGEPLAYLWVPELHKTGHGWHVHFAVGRFVARGLIDEAWGHGFVHIKLIQGVPVGGSLRAEARVAARYLSKYLGKDLSGAGGLNRYDLAQGFQPKRVTIKGHTEAEVLAVASEQMGGPPAYVWRSSVQEGWRQPPAVWAAW